MIIWPNEELKLNKPYNLMLLCNDKNSSTVKLEWLSGNIHNWHMIGSQIEYLVI